METLNKNGVSITQTPGEEKICKILFRSIQGTNLLSASLLPYRWSCSERWLNYLRNIAGVGRMANLKETIIRANLPH